MGVGGEEHAGLGRGDLREGRGGEALTVEAVRLEGTALGQDRQQRLLTELQLADNTITAPKAAAAPGPQSQLEAAQDNRVPARARGSAQPLWLHPTPRQLPCPHGSPALQDFRVSDACVGHVAVHTAAPVPPGARARAARHRLVVAHVGVAQGHIVHAALAGQAVAAGLGRHRSLCALARGPTPSKP